MNKNFTTVTVQLPDGSRNILENIGEELRQQIEWVIIENTHYGFAFALHKKQLAEASYDDQLAAAAAFTEGGRTGNRIEWISVYNAIHTARLNDVLEAIGGDIIRREWYWTEELDEDVAFQSGSSNAWFFSGSYGNLSSYYNRYSAYGARVFRALNL